MDDNSRLNQPRGNSGQFISKDKASNLTEQDLPDLISKSSKMTGALNTLKEYEEEKELEKPLLSVSVNNPFSWILKWINKLRKKQTTTITFRLGIPLIAIPVFVAALASLFYGLGKVTNKPEEKIVEVPVASYNVSKSGILRVIDNGQETYYYLVLPSGEAVVLEPPENIDLSKLDLKRVLVTGEYFEDSKHIKIQNVADMEILPTTPKPIPTLIPTPTPIPTLLPTVAPTPSNSPISTADSSASPSPQ